MILGGSAYDGGEGSKETYEAENHFGYVKKEKLTLKFFFGFSISRFLHFKYFSKNLNQYH